MNRNTLIELRRQAPPKLRREVLRPRESAYVRREDRAPSWRGTAALLSVAVLLLAVAMIEVVYMLRGWTAP